MAAIYQTYADNILNGITPTGTAPSTSYSLAWFTRQNPAERIAWGATSATITFTRGTVAQGDILCIPMHNLSGSVLSVTNGNSFNSGTLTIPDQRGNGFPETLVVDMTGLASDATRTDEVWNIVISGNSRDIVLGGAIAIYGPKRTLTQNIEWGYTEFEQQHVVSHENVYGKRLTYDLQSYSRRVEARFDVVSNAQRELLRDWFQLDHGSARPSLLWLDTDDATTGYFGTWQDEQSIVHRFRGVNDMAVTFLELSKGVAL